jgi:hypothetical protein
MKSNSSNYGSTVPEITADLLADEPADLRRTMRVCESGRDEPDDDGPRKCPYCRRGQIAVEPGCSLSYRCTDCGGSGWITPEEDEPEEDEPEETEENES